jgi:bifunctional DNA-binding transcriptional regulator/antitoxin component of YhaV-PrlF toxin-antitoxin module
VTRLKIHYDGWLALPPALRRQLGLGTNDLLEAELVDGAIVLRPAAKAAGVPKPKSAMGEPPAGVVVPSAGMMEPAAARKPQSGRSGAGDPAPATRRRPGRPRQVPAAAEEPTASLQPEPGDEPAPLIEPGARSELRRQAVPPATDLDLLDLPRALVRDPRPERRGHEASPERERRPFRHVEVRKLEPGRGHNRDRRRASGAPAPRS